MASLSPREETREEVREGRNQWPSGINAEKSTAEEATEYIVYRCAAYRYYDLQDNKLWETCTWDFEGYTLDLFE